MRLFYKIGIRVYSFFIYLAAVFNNKKALQITQSRPGIFDRLMKNIPSDAQIIWIHSSSSGEFEQAVPIIQEIKHQYPHYFILATFFSPSGYQAQKNSPLCDYVEYLPSDTNANAQRFVSIVKPKIALFIKYEFWAFFLRELSRKQIPTFSVSAIFRKNQIFFRPYGRFFLETLKQFTHLYVQNDLSKSILEQHGITHASTTGDTRYDRVLEIKKQSKPYPLIGLFSASTPTIIAGSSWPKEEKFLASFLNRCANLRIKAIIAPHEVDLTHIESIAALLEEEGISHVKYSEATASSLKDASVVIIDSIGHLSSLYKYATIAIIGGGFGAGIHNTLEAAASGLPVLFGPKYHKFDEAKKLIAEGAAVCVANYNEFEQTLLSLLQDKERLERFSSQAELHVHIHSGATTKIMSLIQSYIR